MLPQLYFSYKYIERGPKTLFAAANIEHQKFSIQTQQRSPCIYSHTHTHTTLYIYIIYTIYGNGAVYICIQYTIPPLYHSLSHASAIMVLWINWIPPSLTLGPRFYQIIVNKLHSTLCRAVCIVYCVYIILLLSWASTRYYVRRYNCSSSRWVHARDSEKRSRCTYFKWYI